MDFLTDSFLSALLLIWTLNPDLLEIIWVSLKVSSTSTVMAGVMGVPAGFLIAFKEFRGKRLLITILNTLLALPTVVVGLFVFVLFSRAGPLGGLNLMFTPTVMVIGQAILISPILLGLTLSALSGVDKTILDTARSLGASGFQTAVVVLREARFAVTAAVIMGFGRAISEVGIALMVGGNIRGFTRTLTTAMSLETSMGNIEFSMALGLILMSLAFTVSLVAYRFQQR